MHRSPRHRSLQQRTSRGACLSTRPSSTRLSMNADIDLFHGGSEADLSTWLEQKGIDVSSYGEGPYKSVGSLLAEVQEGESVLVETSEGSALRRVSIISVNIKNKEGRSLYEAKQRLPNGGLRERNILLAEKLLPNETWEQATARGIKEELGSILPENPVIRLMRETYVKSQEISMSHSYPGLPTEYICHSVEAKVEGLPDSGFWTEEVRPDGILRTSWEWRTGP